MSIVYFDSSAFVKLLVEEDGSDIAAALWDGCDAAVSSRLAYPEVGAALAAADRAHRSSAKEHRQAQTMWDDYWAATRAVQLTETVAQHAGHWATAHALRGADAVHLASVLAVGVDDTVFAVWDEGRRAAARQAAVRLAPNL
ncbi:type II toxin-antitoxin system VapC family toxin [Mycobacterium hubeiense]|uniref:type II toxin-antitoxin system VapC family toxin n=1 Tax=Mycobacterium hubeiense TaxID=1867256 RepID=UPI000C7ED6AA|nr:type II toxin-antitoxin system VapC family toxin [Mycobacterium sp. QGD 101]